MQIHISPADGVPIYLQIVNQIKYLISAGRLTPDEELPPIRVLAEQLVVNPNTVARLSRIGTRGHCHQSTGRLALMSRTPA